MWLSTTWFVLVGVLLAGYAVLDGFDLGIGVLYPFIAHDEEGRAALRAAVGPVWDGNEVWLLTGAGALFAAFPSVYATVFSGFYLALMIVLFSLILRAVSLEFRAHDTAWAPLWDAAFFLGSALPALLFGVAVGNITRGVPLTSGGEFAGDFFTLLNPYSLLIGVLGFTALIVHGAAWAALKTSGPLAERARRVRAGGGRALLALVVFAAIATALGAPTAWHAVTGRVIGWLFVALLLVGLGRTQVASRRGSDIASFLGSALSVLSLVGIWASGIFPALVPALGDASRSLTVSNAASSHAALTAMLVIAAIGVPIVLAYTVYIYRVFRGKVLEGY